MHGPGGAACRLAAFGFDDTGAYRVYGIAALCLAPLSLPGLAVDVDVSDLIGAHADYGLKVREILERVDLEDAGRDDDVFLASADDDVVAEASSLGVSVV